MDEEQYILDFLAGELPEQERQAAAERIANDPEFAASVEQYRQLEQQLSDAAAYQHLKSEAMAAVMTVEQNKRIRPLYSPLSLAVLVAAATILLAIAYWLRPNYNQNYLREQYLAAYEKPGLYKGANTVSDSLFAQAQDAYLKGEYVQAVPLFTQIPADHAAYGQAQLFLGTAYLMLGQAADAIAPLQNAINEPATREYARWYLALAYALDEQDERAIAALQQLQAEGGNFHQKDAAALQKQLQSRWRKWAR